MPPDNLLKFAIPCDRLQLKVENGKEIWATLMYKSQRVSPSELKALCDLEDHFEEEDPFSDFLREDPQSGCYRTDLPDGPVYFIQTSGFEYFFTRDGKIPSYFEDLSEIVHETARNNCEGRLILPPNNALASGAFGHEYPAIRLAPDLEVIRGVDTRYRLLNEDGSVIAGALVQNGTVTATFATMAYLGQGVEEKLAERINKIASAPKKTITHTVTAGRMRTYEDDDCQP